MNPTVWPTRTKNPVRIFVIEIERYEDYFYLFILSLMDLKKNKR